MKSNLIVKFICLVIIGVITISTLSYAQKGSVTEATQCDLVALKKSESDFDNMAAEQTFNPSKPNSIKLRSAARAYISESQRCFHQLYEGSNNNSNIRIDDGAVILPGTLTSSSLNNPLIAEEFSLFGAKWGVNSTFNGGRNTQGPGSPGGIVTYSFIPNGVSHQVEADNDVVDNPGTNLAFSSLPDYQSCFETEVTKAFAMWSAVADIQFELVADNGSPSNGNGANADIRIGAHNFDGSSGLLAHAFFPPSNAFNESITGDLHFDRSEFWTCEPQSQSIDIGIVTIHEIGHSIGLSHEEGAGAAIAIMNPFYDPDIVSTLTSDDIDGVVSIYGVFQEIITTTIITPILDLILGDDS